MPALPHDVHDLYLAPVVLAVDALVDELGALEPGALAARLAGTSHLADRTRALREAELIQTLRLSTTLHGWELTVEDRGVRLAHDDHSVVIGLSTRLREFLAGTPSD
jgi:hypothetical protein